MSEGFPDKVANDFNELVIALENFENKTFQVNIDEDSVIDIIELYLDSVIDIIELYLNENKNKMVNEIKQKFLTKKSEKMAGTA